MPSSRDSLTERLQLLVNAYEDGRITTGDNGYDDPKNTHPQSIEGPYELYGLFDDGFDGNGGLLGDSIRALEAKDKELARLRSEVEKLRGAAIANGLERDEANDRLEMLHDALHRAHETVRGYLESPEKRFLLGTLADLMPLARPARLAASPKETDPEEAG